MASHTVMGREEICIKICPRGDDTWEGTRAQIEAEGVIAPDTKWPDGAASQRWTDEQFAYCLHRRRPDDFKGPKSAWANGDWWALRRRHIVLGHDGYAAARLHMAQSALDHEHWKRTQASQVMRGRWITTIADERYQAFKMKFMPTAKTRTRRADAAQTAPNGGHHD